MNPKSWQNRIACGLQIPLVFLLLAAPAGGEPEAERTAAATESIEESAAIEVEVEVEVEVPAEVEAEVEDATLVVWFLSQSPEEIELNRALVEGWAADYTDANVTIDWSPFAFEEWNNAMKLALDGQSGPDIANGSPGGPRIGSW